MRENGVREHQNGVSIGKVPRFELLGLIHHCGAPSPPDRVWGRL